MSKLSYLLSVKIQEDGKDILGTEVYTGPYETDMLVRWVERSRKEHGEDHRKLIIYPENKLPKGAKVSRLGTS